VSRPRRIFIGLNEVAGYYASLAAGFRQLGVPCTFLDERGHVFGYEPVSRLARFMQWADRAAEASRRPRRVAKAVARVAVFAWAVLRHDAFVITSGVSFFKGRDLAILRLLGKRVVVVFTGSDHRPAFLNGRLVAELSAAGTVAENGRQLAFVRRAERHANVIVALSSSAQLHRRPFAHLLAVGIPFATGAAGSDQGGFSPDGGVRIVHSPSDPAYKGTDVIRRTVEELGRRHRIEYRELIGRPNSEVLAALAACDFVIDEIYSDTPLARLATEAAYFGKPAITCGYYASEISADLPPGMIPPATFHHPNELAAAVELFVVDAEARAEAGEAVQAFVRREWAPARVAERYLRLLDGPVPEEWLYDPARLRYVHGWGMTEARVAWSVRRTLAIATPEVLGMGGKLAARLRAVAETGSPNAEG
jgi:glycosyltransferase involved in cell wall biosynthesis